MNALITQAFRFVVASRFGRAISRGGCFAFAFLVLTVLWSHPAGAAVLTVPAQHPTIQGAINAAVNGDQILVSPGYYFERIDLKGKAVHLKSTAGRSQTFVTPNGVAGSVVSCITSESAGCIVEGFTVSGATGSGIAITSSSPIFRFCAINQNYNTGANGGGVAYTGTGGTPRFEDCQFFGNRALTRDGGAMALSATGGTMTCLRCTFSSNESTGSLGGAICANASALTLTNCTFNSNAVTATGGDRQGGAIYTTGALSAVGCAFNSNAVTVNFTNGNDRSGRGGAICASGSIMITNTTFNGNVVNCAEGGHPSFGGTGRAYGGALNLFGTSQVIVAGSSFSNNLSTIIGGNYPREARGGAVAVVNGCDPVFDGCTFTGNSATNPNGSYAAGGTFWWDGGSVGSIVDCTISASTAYSEGGAIYLNGTATPFVLRTTFSNCTAPGGTGGAVRGHSGASAYFSNCRFTNCAALQGGAIFNSTSQPFLHTCIFDHNTSVSGSAIKSDSSGLSNVPTLQSNYFCSNSGVSANWIFGSYNDPKPGSNSLSADCGSDCNANGILDAVEIASGMEDDCDTNGVPDTCQADCNGDGIPNACEIASGESDCDANGVPDSCQLAQGAPDINHDGTLDACDPVDFVGLATEVFPIVDRSSDPTIPSTAVCYRIFAEFAVNGGAIWGVYGNQQSSMVFSSPLGFYESAYGGDLSLSLPCDLSGVSVGARYDSWLTVGSTCAAGNVLQSAGLNFTNFATSGMNDNDCIAYVNPGSAQGIAGINRRVLVAQVTTRDGSVPTGKLNLVGRNGSGTDLLAFAQSWPAPALVDCNDNGVHDAFDIRDGIDLDCDESGIPDSCEFEFPNEDCNKNGTPDLCDIQSGASADINSNHVPDECECAGDVDGDGTVNVDDIIEVILAWGDTGPNPADLNGDQLVNSIDLALVLTYYGACQ